MSDVGTESQVADCSSALKENNEDWSTYAKTSPIRGIVDAQRPAAVALYRIIFPKSAPDSVVLAEHVGCRICR